MTDEERALRDQIAVCRAALAPFADLASCYPASSPGLRVLAIWGSEPILVADLLRARGALEATGET